MNRMTEEKILHITNCQGYFDVSLKWRYAYLQRLTSKLIEKGKLICVGRVKRTMRYKLKELNQ